jgi:hypothetical protein
VEGNACYKFATIRNFIAATDAPPIRVAIDVGVNVGDMALLLRDTFPEARIFGFEAVEEYYRMALERLGSLPDVTLFHRAMTAQHRFADDLGCRPRPDIARLTVLKGLPAAGPGWGGGSIVVPEQDACRFDPSHFARIAQPAYPVTLDDFMRDRCLAEIDLLKMDCEGCEHSVLGCAEPDTLRRVRFIVGEYHGFARFSRVVSERLFRTHKVSLIGERDLGCFFAERLEGECDGILRFDKEGMLALRPWLSDSPSEWHLFNDAYVPTPERYWHALP